MLLGSQRGLPPSYSRYPVFALLILLSGTLLGVSHLFATLMVKRDLRMELQGHLNAHRAGARQWLQLPAEARGSLWATTAVPEAVRLSLMTPAGRVLQDSHKDPASVINLAHSPDVQQALQRGWGHSLIPSLASEKDDEQVLSTAIREGSRVLGILRASRPLEGYHAHQRSLFYKLALTQIVSLLLISGGLGLLARTRSRPFRELVADARELERGEHCQIHITHGDATEPIAAQLGRLQHTAQTQARVIADQRHRQRVLLNHMSEGILAVDNHQNITEINPLAAEWLELDDSLHIRGRSLHSATRNPRLLDLVSRLIDQGEPLEGDIVLTRDGQERILHIRGSQMIDAEQSIGVLVVMRDVTELRKLATLRSDFVANVSHELRTPLTSVRGYAELIQHAPEEVETVSTFSEKIVAQCGRMVSLMNDLLDLTRIENAKEAPAFTQTPLRPILQATLEQSAEAAALRHITLELEADPGLKAAVHPPLFEQAVFNLVQNAIKYTYPDTTVFLKASAENGTLEIRVRDQGPGIAPAHHERLFERFYRVDKARSRAAGGTGLGLSIVKHIAQSHGGTVSVESTLGQGASFLLRIPIQPAERSGS